MLGVLLASSPGLVLGVLLASSPGLVLGVLLASSPGLVLGVLLYTKDFFSESVNNGNNDHSGRLQMEGV